MGIKFKVNEDFFNSWNSRMAYVLGYIYADGNLQNCSYVRAKYVKVASIDLDSLERIRNWLSSEHAITKRKSFWKNGNPIYSLSIGSHKLYDSLLRLGLYPHKSLTVQLPQIPQAFFMDFVRGYFDGDGCVSLYKIPITNGNYRARKLSIIFTSGSKVFLSQLSRLISCYLDIKAQRVLQSRTAFQLRYSTTDTVRLFHALYKDCKKGEYLERKHQIFQEFFELHKRRSGEDGQRDGLQNRYAPVRIRSTPHSERMYRLYSSQLARVA